MKQPAGRTQESKLIKMKKVEKVLEDFMNNEDVDKGEEDLRNSITTLDELRFIIARASQLCPDEVEDIKECLISL